MGPEALEGSIKDVLMNTNEEFKRLATLHRDYSEKLDHLAHKVFLSEAEKMEEVNLKKKKLQLKDQMQLIINKHREGAA